MELGQSLITEEIQCYEEKSDAKFQATNIACDMINTNDESVCRSEGRRYFLADISAIHMQDHTFYGALAKQIENDESGAAFYTYLYEIDTDNFHEKDMPLTENKLNATSDKLPPTFKFLKEKYVSKSKGVDKTPVADFYKEYQDYCFNAGIKTLTKLKFVTKLKEIQIDHFASNGSNYYLIVLSH